MGITDWIDKNISEIQKIILYSKYFDSIVMEQGIDVYFLFNRQLGIDLVLREDLSIKAIHFFFR